MKRRIVFFLLTTLFTVGVPVAGAAASSASVALDDRCYYEIFPGTSVHEEPNGTVIIVVNTTAIVGSFDERDPNWVGVSIPRGASGDLPVNGYVRRTLARLVRCV